MDQEILFYLLEGPKSVSDMIRTLTTKTLSDFPDKRAEEIPRIAGNWFKDDGYLTRLQEDDRIKDQGRQYAVNRWTLVDTFLRFIGATNAFPDLQVRGGDALVAPAYRSMMKEYTYRRLKRRLRQEVFHGETMNELFSFDRWRECMCTSTRTRSNSISKYNCIFDVHSIVYLVLLFTVLKSRYTILTERLRSQEEYFRLRRRRTTLGDNSQELAKRTLQSAFPWASWQEDAFEQEAVASVFTELNQAPDLFDEDQVELLADVFLLSLGDRTEMFEQHAKYGDDDHMFFDLLERGLLIDPDDLDKDPQTGNLILPLHDVRSYLDHLARVPETTPIASKLDGNTK